MLARTPLLNNANFGLSDWSYWPVVNIHNLCGFGGKRFFNMTFACMYDEL